MKKVQIPVDQRKREGSFIQSRFYDRKAVEPLLTVESLAHEIGVSQGLISQWFAGRTPVRDVHLLWLGPRLEFDPVELRPSLRRYASTAGEFFNQVDELSERDFEFLDRYLHHPDELKEALHVFEETWLKSHRKRQ